jgi:hypothetical protein
VDETTLYNPPKIETHGQVVSSLEKLASADWIYEMAINIIHVIVHLNLSDSESHLIIKYELVSFAHDRLVHHVTLVLRGDSFT